MPRMEQKRMTTMLPKGACCKPAEVVDHADGDQHPEDDEELALLGQVGLAGLPDDVGHVEHRLVGRQVLRLVRLDESEDESEDADEQAEIHDVNAVQHAAEHVEIHVAQIGQHDVRFAGEGGRRHP